MTFRRWLWLKDPRQPAKKPFLANKTNRSRFVRVAEVLPSFTSRLVLRKRKNELDKADSDNNLQLSHTYPTACTMYAQCHKQCHEQCHNNVTTMSQQRHNNVTTMSQQCHNNVTTMSEQCQNNVTTMSQQCQNNVRTMSEQCHNNVRTTSEQRHNEVLIWSINMNYWYGLIILTINMELVLIWSYY